MSAGELEHTPEPWGVYAQPVSGAGDAVLELVKQVQATHPIASEIYLLDAGGKCPATTGCGPTSEANAARIVACVNACAGIADPTALRAQRDALLEALERAAQNIDAMAKALQSEQLFAAGKRAAGWAEDARAAIALAQAEAGK